MNRIKEFRKLKGMTQRELAKAVGTSQQQIQRIESGSVEARIDVALKICEALESTMPKLFPHSAKPLSNAQRRGVKPELILEDSQLIDELSHAGIGMDLSTHFIELNLKCGNSVRISLPKEAKGILWQAIQEEVTGTKFCIFNSAYSRVALNLDHVVTAHFLFEAFDTPADQAFDGLSSEDDDELRMISPSLRNTFCLEIEADTEDLSVEDDPDRQSVQLQDLFHYTSNAEFVPGSKVLITNRDGEPVWIRLDEASVISVPLNMVEPSIFLDAEDGDQ